MAPHNSCGFCCRCFSTWWAILDYV